MKLSQRSGLVRILHLEDDSNDAELIAGRLSAQLNCQIARVSDRSSFEGTLANDNFHIILSDFKIPGYSGSEALEFARATRPEVPFVFVSGTIGELAAVDCLKRGAADYILKDAPDRLIPAVDRALKDALAAKKQKETETALAESQERFRMLVERCPIGIYIIQDNHFIYGNPQFAQILGYSEGELRGLSLDTLAHFKPFVSSHNEPARELEYQTGDRTDIGLRRKDGAQVQLEIHRVEIQLDGRNAILGVVVDNTEKRRLRTRLDQFQRIESIGTLASAIAHDLNNVLTPITIAVGVLQEENHRKEEAAWLDVIARSAQTGAGMVQRILTFAKGSESPKTRVHLSRVIRNHERILRKTLSPSIQVEVKCARSLRPVLGNEMEILQALMNLCVNARDALQEGGKIVISAENKVLSQNDASKLPGASAGSYSVLSVSDNGSGIPENIIDKIFDPFFSTKQIGHGTGLGLPAVARIVKAHNGFIDVSSAIGAGTRFSIYFPSITTRSSHR